MVTLEELLENLRRAGAGPAQLAQEEANWHKAQEVMRRPRHERATPYCALNVGSKYSANPEQVAYWSQDPAVRAAQPPEPDEKSLRQAISKEHRKLSAEGGDPSRLAELLKKKRGTK